MPGCNPTDVSQAQYILTTLAVGFPAWVEMRRQIQEARIESIMKGQ